MKKRILNIEQEIMNLEVETRNHGKNGNKTKKNEKNLHINRFLVPFDKSYQRTM